YINNLPAKSDPATTVLVPGPYGCVSTRTADQIRSDIGAAAASHTLVSHTDWSTYFDGQALKTTSSPTFAGINISNGGLIDDWVYLGKAENPSSPNERYWYKAYELTGTGRA